MIKDRYTSGKDRARFDAVIGGADVEEVLSVAGKYKEEDEDTPDNVQLL